MFELGNESDSNEHAGSYNTTKVESLIISSRLKKNVRAKNNYFSSTVVSFLFIHVVILYYFSTCIYYIRLCQSMHGPANFSLWEHPNCLG